MAPGIRCSLIGRKKYTSYNNEGYFDTSDILRALKFFALRQDLTFLHNYNNGRFLNFALKTPVVGHVYLDIFILNMPHVKEYLIFIAFIKVFDRFLKIFLIVVFESGH